MVLPWLLLGTAPRAVLGSVEAALCAGVRSKKALDTAISLGFHRSQYSYPLNPGVTSKSLKIQSFQGAASNTEVLKNSEDHAHSSLIPTVIDFSAPRTGRNKYML
ncbi:thiosulfate sulfurtransferase/rhodanese-like domain-containing protein 3 isoform X5 [Cebus imitator]|uniref:thiosulfate sulfurtransferase/rhodanese-like domain-containing protein 3 isoform X5 n=1 Tax=Cebus imitator TaxID=2715852 RepID=UPI001898DBED|nr:thiosulfate sulfurtransferase/rhodanese-like domain-containing protein 3 isoform X5 [Cebus imitator]